MNGRRRRAPLHSRRAKFIRNCRWFVLKHRYSQSAGTIAKGAKVTKRSVKQALRRIDPSLAEALLAIPIPEIPIYEKIDTQIRQIFDSESEKKMAAITLSENELKVLDELRGDQSRSHYLGQLMELAIEDLMTEFGESCPDRKRILEFLASDERHRMRSEEFYLKRTVLGVENSVPP